MKFVPSELFQLNEKRTLNTITIGEGGHQLVVIDDLFKYPQDISLFMEELYYTDNRDIRNLTPAFRCSMGFPVKDLAREIFAQHFEKYKIQTLSHLVWSFDKYYDKSNIIEVDSIIPHVDSERPWEGDPWYAAVIYMNEKRIHGGTQFIRRIDLDKKYETIESYDEWTKVLVDNKTLINSEDVWNYDSNQWEQYYMLPMKFNRLVSYRSNLIHSIYTDWSYYKDTPRKTITGSF